MLFNSFTFWIFFGLVAAVCPLLGHRRRNRFLLVASWVFYGAWDWRFLGLIGVSTLVDFIAGQRIAASRESAHRRSWLVLSLVANLGLLAVFKYLGFFIAEFNSLLRSLGLGAGLPGVSLILPVGISFYTFQTLSYTIDVYRGITRPVRNLGDFALYVTFFPQLVAGPIERSEHLVPQVLNPRPPLTGERFREGLYLVLTGLYRKVVIADNLALIVNHVFGKPPAELQALEVLLGVYAFAFQIYGDFSGYSAIAQGTAKWLGFDLMDNFRHPYFAASPQEFWRRWHISLSTWLRDYLYIPLGGNRVGTARTYANLLITMLLGGLWHGAAWTFVVWGGIHGVWLALHRFLFAGAGPAPAPRGSPLRRMLGVVLTFHLVCLTWLFFRAGSIGHAWSMFRTLGSGSWEVDGFSLGAMSLLGFLLLPFLAFEAWVERRGDLLALTRVAWGWRVFVYGFLLAMLLFFGAPVQQEFIYFQF